MTNKPDFYKQTIEKNEDDLAESVLTPEDISENDKKEIETRRELVSYKAKIDFPEIQTNECLENSEVAEVILKDLTLTPFLNNNTTIPEKINALSRRFHLYGSFIGTSVLLRNILDTLKVEGIIKKTYCDLEEGEMYFSELQLRISLDDYLKHLPLRRGLKKFEIGDLVRVDKTPRSENLSIVMNYALSDNLFRDYVPERNRAFPRGLTGIVTGFETTTFENRDNGNASDFIMVKFPYSKRKEESCKWKVLLEYSPTKKKNIGAYIPNELDLIIPTKIELKRLLNLFDSIEDKIYKISLK